MDRTREIIASPQFEVSANSELRLRMAEATDAWLNKSTSKATRINYACDLGQFLSFVGIGSHEPDRLTEIRPQHISSWRDHLLAAGLTNHSVVRKLSTLRSMLKYAS